MSFFFLATKSTQLPSFLHIDNIPAALNDQLPMLHLLRERHTLQRLDMTPDAVPLPQDLEPLALGLGHLWLLVQQLDHLDQRLVDLVHLLRGTQACGLAHVVAVLALALDQVQLMVAQRVVERKGVALVGEALNSGEGLPVVGADVCGATGLVCDLLQ